MKPLLARSIVLLPLASALSASQEAAEPPLAYEVDLRNSSDDLFHVSVRPGPLAAEDRYFDFVAFAPGVHSVLNFGRFVRDLHAFDADGNEVAVEQVDMNRWELAEPSKVDRIVYDIEDSFDTEIEDHRVIPCGGTGIEDDYVLLNTFGVLGYFEHHLACPVELRVEHDPRWTAATALRRSDDGAWRAPSYRFLADSPILLGNLTTASIRVGEIDVDVFVHSSLDELNADQVLLVAGEVLEAAASFIGFAPVDRYVFLMVFIDREAMQRNRMRAFGALEHSHSSLYTLPAFPGALEGLARTVAHEFMHVLTPLHLKSEVIADFDYSVPTTDRHVWLYEGVTEWSADMLRLRGGVVDLDQYLEVLSGKIQAARRYDPEYDLTRISLEWWTEPGLRQYGNIYQLGALTAAMLDIRLLRLSGGERGLREVFLDFVRRYGPDAPFDDETFLDELVAATDPEIEGFLRDHVLGNEPLPFGACFDALGIEYEEDSTPALSVSEDCTPEQLALREAWMRNATGD